MHEHNLNSGFGTAEIHILGNGQKSCCSQSTTFTLIPAPRLRAPRLRQVSAAL